ncbi:MAG: hypothetical protein AAGN46_12850, partial [Acidobacteriota bacterium]
MGQQKDLCELPNVQNCERQIGPLTNNSIIGLIGSSAAEDESPSQSHFGAVASATSTKRLGKRSSRRRFEDRILSQGFEGCEACFFREVSVRKRLVVIGRLVVIEVAQVAGAESRASRATMAKNER